MNTISPPSPSSRVHPAEPASTAKEVVPLKVIFLNSHPIQYYAPMYKYMDKREDIDLSVIYCSRHGMSEDMDEGFKVKVKWDIPLLEGYQSVFLKNYSPSPNVYNLYGLINFGIVPYLFNAPKSILIIHGWNYLTNLIAIVVGKLRGHVVCMRGDTPGKYEARRGWFMNKLRKFIFGSLLFPFIDYFLYVGKENKYFYELMGVPEHKLKFSPHAVDNQRFSTNHQRYRDQRDEIKNRLGLPLGKRVIIFVGKYI